MLTIHADASVFDHFCIQVSLSPVETIVFQLEKDASPRAVRSFSSFLLLLANVVSTVPVCVLSIFSACVRAICVGTESYQHIPKQGGVQGQNHPTIVVLCSTESTSC